MIDILYLAHKRPEFTRASLDALLKNTDWSRARLIVYTDGVPLSRDWAPPPSVCVLTAHYGGPVAIMNTHLWATKAELFAKIDNDTIVPPGWLDACLSVMEAHPELDLLGIESPASRTPNPDSGRIVAPPESLVPASAGYAPCDAIGGIGLMRTSAFAGRSAMKPHSIYGGFTDWQLAHPEVRKGWIVPPLKVFLLDRLPIEPWASLSREYIAKGWQRPWTNYSPESVALWDWWNPAEMRTYV
jgi:hypothetical protein